MLKEEIKSFLEEKVDQYNRPEFTTTDPVQIPHAFTKKEDIEIAGFLAATIAWGKRPMIIRNAERMMEAMGQRPFDFVMNASEKDMEAFKAVKHRTFNGIDGAFFIESLRNIYTHHNGLESVFQDGFEQTGSIKGALAWFRDIFFSIDYPDRTTKHIANVNKGASGKRLNMFLRWMVRNDQRGVDFGMWKGISAAELMLPLDVHTGNVARKLSILERKSSDWKAVEEVTAVLREFDPADPVKYDFALFGLGIFEQF
ncbi:TIGR02757 family protein [Puteibacter caeruleilacunae]|nr:TIGR02757 family protein [Puteibacter caeruleilacunae]